MPKEPLSNPARNPSDPQEDGLGLSGNIVRQESSDANTIRCQFCPGVAFRRSRVRAADLPDIVLMRYPVRCLRCSQRQTVSFAVAGISVPSHVKHTRPIRPDETWKEWTEGVPTVFSSSPLAPSASTSASATLTGIDQGAAASRLAHAGAPNVEKVL